MRSILKSLSKIKSSFVDKDFFVPPEPVVRLGLDAALNSSLRQRRQALNR